MKKYALFILLFLLCLSSVHAATLVIRVNNSVDQVAISTFCISAVGTNTTQEGCTFNGTFNLNMTGTFNITTMYVGAGGQQTSCYQEQANVSTACGGKDSGNYSYAGAWTDPANASDANYSTFAIGTTTTLMFINYTIPTHGNINGSIIQVKGTDDIIHNITLVNPNTIGTTLWCNNFSGSLHLRIATNTGATTVATVVSCRVQSGAAFPGTYETLTGGSFTGGSVRAMYEEAIFWNMTSPSPTFLNVTVSNYNFAGDQNLTIDTSQAQINLSAYRLYLNNSIASFNTTSNRSNQSTTVNSILVNANNGSNNIKVDVAGNFSLNLTCTITSPLSVGFCNATGIYDNRYTIGASNLSGQSIPSFTLLVDNTSVVSYNQSTNNHSLVIPLLQGYTYLFQMQANGYAYQNLTAPANASTHLFNFTLFQANTLNITFRYDNNNTIVNTTTVTLEAISSAQAFNVSTNNGTLYLGNLAPGDYSLVYSAPGFTTRTYEFTLSNNTYTELTLRMLSASLATNISVFVTDLDSKPLEGYVVKLLRYDINTNTYVLNQVFTSNVDGQGVFSVVLSTQLYEFIVENAGQVVLTTNPSFIFGTTLTLAVPIASFNTQNYFNSQNVLGTITFNNATNVATFIFNDQDNTATQGCLYTYRTFNVTQLFYNSTCVSASAGSMTSPIFLQNGTGWQWVGRVIKGGQNITVATLSLDARTIPRGETTTKLGLFVMIIIMLIVGFMLIENIRLFLIINGAIPFLFMLTGFVAVNPAWGFVLWVVSIIFAVVLSL